MATDDDLPSNELLKKLDHYKQNINEIGTKLMQNCDVLHKDLYEKKFIPCFKSKCQEIYDNVNDKNNFVFQKDNNYESILVHKDKIK